MSNKVMGYARVSTKEQHLERQLVELNKYVQEENIVTDKASGKSFARKGYEALKGALGLRSGDTLVIKSLDRLSRNKNDIKTELEWFKNNHIRLMIIDLPTTMIQVPNNQDWILDMINNILIEVLASIAEQERNMIRQRQREGIDIAKAQGRNLGRPKKTYPINWEEYYYQWKSDKITAKQMMDELKLKPTTFYKLAKEYKK